jgi:hypothetical protein
MALSDSPVPGDAVPATPPLEIVVPVHDEAAVPIRSVDYLTGHLPVELPFTCRVTIVDNASTDGTWIEASKLAALRLEAKGRAVGGRRAGPFGRAGPDVRSHRGGRRVDGATKPSVVVLSTALQLLPMLAWVFRKADAT